MDAMFSIETDGKLDDILQYVMDRVSDEEIDQLELERVAGAASGIAYEPVTIAAIIAASTPVALAVLRLIERYLQGREHRDTLRIVSSSAHDNPQISRELASLAKSYAGVEIKQGLISMKR